MTMLATVNTGRRVRFFVPGVPAPQGSKRHVGRGIMVESSKAVGPWRERVALAAHDVMIAGQMPVFSGAVEVLLDFVMPRPKSAPKGRYVPAAKRPDLDKLCRSCLDALTSVVFSDDSQVVRIVASKELAAADGSTPTGVTVIVTERP